MDTNQMNQLRSKIEANLAALDEAATFAKSELRASSEVNANVFRDPIDCAKTESDLKTASDIHNHNVTQQILLENALVRMSNGTFGFCVTCGEEIEQRRLLAYPGAFRCIDCQECIETGRYPDFSRAQNTTQIESRWAA
jgi:DnaK suppressor protein